MTGKRFASLSSPLFALALVVGLAAPAAAKSFVLNPQAGATWSNYSFDEDESIEDEARVGWALGGNLRFGGRMYVAPGLYYQSTGFEATGYDSLSASDITEAVGVNAFYVPVTVGYFLTPSSTATNMASTGLRVYAGPAATIVTSVGDNEFGLEKDHYESVIWGGVIGAGFDLTAVTIDVNYEIGLSGVFTDVPDDANAKQNVLRGLVGLKF